MSVLETIHGHDDLIRLTPAQREQLEEALNSSDMKWQEMHIIEI